MRPSSVVLVVLLVLLGGAAVALGGADDSPGLQGLGLLLVLGAGVVVVRTRRAGRRG